MPIIRLIPAAAAAIIGVVDCVFRRINSRQYGIGLLRNGARDIGGDVAVRLAPGDARVPHDLVHFVVEEQSGLTLGIFGQAAAGGDVGGFFRAVAGKRGRAQQAKRSQRLGSAGRAQVGRSEQLAGLAYHGRIPSGADPLVVTPDLRMSINRRLDEVLRRWEDVAVGEDLVMAWPQRLTVRYGRIP
ncbi:MAG: hypothetical protein JST91_31025 [Actinobacteria bacterium]|nr:hypothetical protein [Actinomycetota bacterium]